MISFKEFITEKCWTGYKRVPGTKAYSPGSCEKEEVEKPTGKLKDACWTGYTAVGTKKKDGRTVPNCVPEEVEMEAYHDPWKDKYFGPGEVVKQKYRVKTDDKTYNVRADTEKHAHELVTKHAPDSTIISIQHKGSARWSEQVEIDETAAWQRKAGKDPKGGLNRKGIASYRREHPGSKLSMAVTTKPSKLKKGSKAANRRKSFCARMSGMKRRLTSAKTARDPNSRINKSLRKWNC